MLLPDEPNVGMRIEERQRVIDRASDIWEKQIITVVSIECDTSGIEELKANDSIRQRHLALWLSVRPGWRNDHRTQTDAIP